MNATLKWTGILLLSASAGGVLLYRRKALLPLIQTVRRRFSPKEHPDQAALTAVADGIGRYAAEFEGLYESLYQAAGDPDTLMTDVYEEWCGRAEIAGDPAFQNAFAALFPPSDLEDEALARKKYALLLGCIDKAGIRRERGDTVCIADDAMRRAYIAPGGKKPEVGQQYTIVKSAWVRGETIIEYGMVLPDAVTF